MITPLFHVTLPSLDDNSPESHFAPLVFALEGLIAIDKFHIERSIRRAQAGLGPPIPPLYASGVRYAEDTAGREDWRDVYVILQRGAGDCLPVSTLVMRDDFTTIPMLALKPGDRIMGKDGWTEVREHAVTGEKDILAFDLSNGCTLRCSPEHRVFVDVDGEVVEKRAKDVAIGDDLVMANAVPLASSTPATGSKLDALGAEQRAWLLGAYVADGWTSDTYRSSISGRDGKPKEQQKRDVESMLKAIDVKTRWHERYIAINDSSIAGYFATCGGHAPQKRVPSLAIATEAEVRALIEGLAADAGMTNSGSRVFSTTSPELALQLRVLHRMLGLSVSIRRLDEHGGLGTHPIYRVIPRTRTREGYAPRRDQHFARVRSIADGGTELCCDITTDTGSFWLPESDVLVHNCDNLVAWRCAELRVAGVYAEPVIKWQHLPFEVAVGLGYPAAMVAHDGLWMVHCCVRMPDGSIEDPSKALGMGAEYTNRV
jgi:hypothetical protein